MWTCFIINPNITGIWIEQPDVHKDYTVVSDILQIFSHLKIIILCIVVVNVNFQSRRIKYLLSGLIALV